MSGLLEFAPMPELARARTAAWPNHAAFSKGNCPACLARDEIEAVGRSVAWGRRGFIVHAEDAQ